MEKKTLGFVLAAAGPFFWGSSGTVAQHLFNTTNVSPMWLVAVRMVVSGLLLVLYGTVRHVPMLAIFKRPAAAIKLVAFSLLGMVGTQLTYFMAISEGNAATAAILQALSPVLLIIFLAVRLWRFPSKIDVISVASAIIGTVLIVTEGSLHSLALPLPALILGGLAAIGATVYTLMPTQLIKTYGATAVVGWSMLIGGACVFIGSQAWRHTPRFNGIAWLEVAFVVIFGTMLAYLFFLQSLEFILPTTASVLGTIEPLSATILSVLFLSVNFNVFGIVGAVMIVGVTGLQFIAARQASFGSTS